MNAFYDALDILSGMIRIPSFSRDENEVADFLSETWEKAGYKVNRKGNNLWMVAPGFALDKPTVLLNSHIDTVKPAAGWSRDPFDADMSEDDRLPDTHRISLILTLEEPRFMRGE